MDPDILASSFFFFFSIFSTLLLCIMIANPTRASTMNMTLFLSNQTRWPWEAHVGTKAGLKIEKKKKKKKKERERERDVGEKGGKRRNLIVGPPSHAYFVRNYGKVAKERNWVEHTVWTRSWTKSL